MSYLDGTRVAWSAEGIPTAVTGSGGLDRAFSLAGSAARTDGVGDTWREYHEDGTLCLRHPDGVVTTVAPDGTRNDAPGSPAMTVLANGVTRTDLTGGGFVLLDVAGHEVTWSPASSTTPASVLAHHVSGTSLAVQQDVLDGREDGTARVHDDALGTETILRADGTVSRERRADGSYVVRDAQGRRMAEVAPDGSRTSFTWRADGTSTGTRADGQVDSYDATGRLFRSVTADKVTLDHPAGGDVVLARTYASHLVEQERQDGSHAWILPDGATITKDVAGTLAAVDAQGQAIAVSSDATGVITLTLADGTKRVLRSGSVETWSAAGTLVEALLATGTRYHVDGLVSVYQLADGTSTRYNPDESVTTLSTGGTVASIQLQEGTAATRNATDGSWSAVDSDGATHLFGADGSLFSVTASDGTIRTWNSDGTTVSLHPSGTIGYSRADGTLEHETAPDGSITRYDTSGVKDRVEHPDGSVDHWLHGRLWSTTHPDGSAWTLDGAGAFVSWSLPGDVTLTAGCTPPAGLVTVTGGWSRVAADNTVTTWRTDGSVVTTAATSTTTLGTDGVSTRVDLDGTTTTIGLEGTVTVQRSGQPTQVLAADGTREVIHGDGTHVSTDPYGSTRWAFMGGATVEQGEDGITAARADGSWLRVQADGTRIEGGTDGSLLVTIPDGSTIATASTGVSPVTTLAAGSTATATPAGAISSTDAWGTVTTWSADGGVVKVASDGARTEWTPGGSSISVSTSEGTTTTTALALDGTTTWVDGNVTEITHPDGRITSLGADNVRTETAVDGTTTRILPDGTRFVTSRGQYSRAIQTRDRP